MKIVQNHNTETLYLQLLEEPGQVSTLHHFNCVFVLARRELHDKRTFLLCEYVPG